MVFGKFYRFKRIKNLISLLMPALVGLLWPCSLFAWDATGHRLIVQIAYDQLAPETRKHFSELLQTIDYPKYRHDKDQLWQRAAIWMDELKYHDVNAFDQWHYIDIPWVETNDKNIAIPSPNAVWAIAQAKHVLQSPRASRDEKALFLRTLLHIVADLHQPLHCIAHYTAAHPHGDLGGNLFILANGETLHALWDRGLGLWPKDKVWNSREIKRQAKRMEKIYPLPNIFQDLQDRDPEHWAMQGWAIAKARAYQIPEGAEPSYDYLSQNYPLIEKQIVLAGYRLAKLVMSLTPAINNHA